MVTDFYIFYTTQSKSHTQFPPIAQVYRVLNFSLDITLKFITVYIYTVYTGSTIVVLLRAEPVGQIRVKRCDAFVPLF